MRIDTVAGMRWRTDRFTSGLPGWLTLTISVLLLLVFVMPSFDSSDTIIKPQNLLPVLVAAMLCVRAGSLRFPAGTLTALLIICLPLMLLLQGAASVLTHLLPTAGALDIAARTDTVLKQLRDPLGAWLVLLLLLGHYRLLVGRNTATTALQVTLLAGASSAAALLVTYVIAPTWADNNYFNPRGFLAGFEGPNSMAAAAALLIPFGAAALFKSRGALLRIASLISLSGFVALLLLSGSRGALVSLAAAGFIAIGFAVLLARRVRLKQYILAPILLVVLAVAISITSPGPVDRLLRTDFGSLTTDLSTSRRVVQLETAAYIMKNRPLTGVGLGGFESAYTTLNAEAEATITPHNTILYVGSQGGILALFALLLYYGVIAVLASRAYLRRQDAWGVAALSFPLCLVFLDLFFPYSFSHDVGTVIVMLLTAIYSFSLRPEVPA